MKMPDLLGNISKDSKTKQLICSIWSKHEEHMEIIVLYNKRKKSSNCCCIDVQGYLLWELTLSKYASGYFGDCAKNQETWINHKNKS